MERKDRDSLEGIFILEENTCTCVSFTVKQGNSTFKLKCYWARRALRHKNFFLCKIAGDSLNVFNIFLHSRGFSNTCPVFAAIG